MIFITVVCTMMVFLYTCISFVTNHHFYKPRFLQLEVKQVNIQKAEKSRLV